MNQKIPFIHTEFMTWLTRTRKTKPSSAKHHASILNTTLSLIFGTVQVSTAVQRLTTHAISNHQINNPRYGSTWDINQLFEYWRERSESNLLSNEELQSKLASLLMSLCFNIEQQFAFHPNNQFREKHDVRKTEDPRVYPTETFFVWLTRLSEHFQQSPTNIIHLFWTENWKQADQKYDSRRLERLVQTLAVQIATTNSIRHALSTELAEQGFDMRAINVFTHHTPDSKMNKKFYIFVVNKEQDSIASVLVKNHGEKKATQIISKQRGGTRVSEGDGLQQFPQGDDLQSSPKEILASPLSFPIISTKSIVEAESPNDHKSAKVQNSQMQKDDQDMEPQDEAQNSSLTKDSDRAATA
ncbi:MAG: hypothetical protein EZS28_028090 [Streblomastix strix]|uniref:Tyr recombinase domain-containing protein n=1 Tax=Streblomastix strix TaxID=222440 RepID=A0A5J4V1P5_9EUKA|nr:MAG: hypothetical protein EZS28_028090 [Streblomastix strix]